jgi:copper(I)-binding protein
MAQAQTVAERVEVMDPYVRAVPPGQSNSATFMQLNNTDNQNHALLAAETPAAKVVELHSHFLVEGMMQMRPVEQVDLPANAVTNLQPGGLHVMLIGLQQKLVPGEMVPLTLLFEDGSKLPVSVPVRNLRMHSNPMQAQDDTNLGKVEDTP